MIKRAIKNIKLDLHFLKHKKEYYSQIESFLKRENYFFSEDYVKKCFKHYKHIYKKYGAKLESDYFGANLFLKSDLAISNSFANFGRFDWRKKCQDQEKVNVFVYKNLFYSTFKGFLGRNYLYLKECSKNDLISFITFNEEYVLKEVSGYGGKQVTFITLSSNAEVNNFAEQYLGKTYVLEQKVQECDELSSFNPGSLNTLRIITIIDEHGLPHVAAAILRIGWKDKIDNFSSGGICCLIDVDTGLIISPGYTRDGGKHLYHPGSQKQLIGTKILNWDEYKQFAVKLANVVPSVRFVGWDIFKDKDEKYCVIEGNDAAGGDILERYNLRGFFPLFNELLNK